MWYHGPITDRWVKTFGVLITFRLCTCDTIYCRWPQVSAVKRWFMKLNSTFCFPYGSPAGIWLKLMPENLVQIQLKHSVYSLSFCFYLLHPYYLSFCQNVAMGSCWCGEEEVNGSWSPCDICLFLFLCILFVYLLLFPASNKTQNWYTFKRKVSLKHLKLEFPFQKFQSALENSPNFLW